MKFKSNWTLKKTPYTVTEFNNMHKNIIECIDENGNTILDMINNDIDIDIAEWMEEGILNCGANNYKK